VSYRSGTIHVAEIWWSYTSPCMEGTDVASVMGHDGVLLRHVPPIYRIVIDTLRRACICGTASPPLPNHGGVNSEMFWPTLLIN